MGGIMGCCCSSRNAAEDKDFKKRNPPLNPDDMMIVPEFTQDAYARLPPSVSMASSNAPSLAAQPQKKVRLSLLKDVIPDTATQAAYGFGISPGVTPVATVPNCSVKERVFAAPQHLLQRGQAGDQTYKAQTETTQLGISRCSSPASYVSGSTKREIQPSPRPPSVHSGRETPSQKSPTKLQSMSSFAPYSVMSKMGYGPPVGRQNRGSVGQPQLLPSTQQSMSYMYGQNAGFQPYGQQQSTTQQQQFGIPQDYALPQYNNATMQHQTPNFAPMQHMSTAYFDSGQQSHRSSLIEESVPIAASYKHSHTVVPSASADQHTGQSIYKPRARHSLPPHFTYQVESYVKGICSRALSDLQEQSMNLSPNTTRDTPTHCSPRMSGLDQRVSIINAQIKQR